MSDSSYDRAINSAKAQVDQHQQRCEDLASNHDEVIGRFLIAWANYMREGALNDKPDVANSQGLEGLGQMKTAFNKLVEKYPALTADALKEHVFWPHRQPLPAEISSGYGPSYELEQKHMKSLDQVIRELIGHVAVILAKHGFIDTGRDHEWNPTGGGNLSYAYGIPTHIPDSGKEVSNLKNKYSEATKNLVKSTIELRSATHAKEAAEAKDLWDKA